MLNVSENICCIFTLIKVIETEVFHITDFKLQGLWPVKLQYVLLLHITLACMT